MSYVSDGIFHLGVTAKLPVKLSIIYSACLDGKTRKIMAYGWHKTQHRYVYIHYSLQIPNSNNITYLSGCT